MQPPPLSKSVLRDDGVRGTIVSSDTPGRLILKFEDGTSLRVMPDALVHQGDGSYRLVRNATGGRGRTAFGYEPATKEPFRPVDRQGGSR